MAWYKRLLTTSKLDQMVTVQPMAINTRGTSSSTQPIFDGQGLTAINNSSEDRPASIHGKQKTTQIDDKLFTGWFFRAFP
jgi:hypothetical protein